MIWWSQTNIILRICLVFPPLHLLVSPPKGSWKFPTNQEGEYLFHPPYDFSCRKSKKLSSWMNLWKWRLSLPPRSHWVCFILIISNSISINMSLHRIIWSHGLYIIPLKLLITWNNLSLKMMLGYHNQISSAALLWVFLSTIHIFIPFMSE